MKKQSKQKGITLVALVITIIILLILAGITISSISGEDGLIVKVNKAKKAQIKAEMKETLILAINELQLEKEGKATLDNITQEWADNSLEDYNPQITSDAAINGKKVTMKKDNVTVKYIIDENLNITEVENDSSIEFSYEVKSRTGDKVQILIHVQDEENGLSMIELSDKDSMTVEGNKKKEIGIDYEVELGVEYKVKITSESGETKEETIWIKDYWHNIIKNFGEGVEIDNPVIKAAYNKQYQATITTGDEYILKTLTVTMEGQEVTTSGNNIVDVTTGIINIEKVTGDIEIAATAKKLYTSDGSWDGKVNSPLLLKGMTGIYWDEKGREVTVTEQNDDNWYNYENRKWANAKTEDGSYWVWIPRYAYQITSGCYTRTAGEIKIKFLQGKENKDENGTPIKTTYPEVENGAMKDYVVHPAFTNGTANKFKNGEWDDDIKGIWVAKYEMSMETNKVATTTGSATVGDVSISSTIKAVSKPGVTSWRNISIGKAYDNSYYYSRNKESHMMKNSEWGAVAYLAHSSYGRNKTEITTNGGYNTGGSQGATALTNKNQSSTGNETGIYDLSGGTMEYTAGYVANKRNNLKNGSTFADDKIADPDANLSLSTKYATVYPYDSSNDSEAKNYARYKDLKSTTYGFGDAILETSTNTNVHISWNNDFCAFIYTYNNFTIRGGLYDGGSNTGPFAFNICGGSASGADTFRVVFIGN